MTMEEMNLKIAVCGLTGAGKSTILNGIVGRVVFKEGDYLTHETKKVTPHSWRDDDNNYEVTVYDTPGFEDDTNNADQYRADIKEKCRDVDLLLYCISVEEARPMLVRDTKTLKELKNVFDADVWDHCIVVLTFANAIVLRSQTKHRARLMAKRKVADDYHTAIADWTKKIQEVLKELELPEKIPIIPAGSGLCFSILNDDNYWLTDLYHKAVDQTDEAKSDVLVLLNHHRMKAKSVVKMENFDVNITDQPIIITNNSTKIGRRLREIAAAVGAGSVTGAVGATVGATVGALAIGLPTFGIAAGFGLVLGGAIGAGIGIGVGIGVYKIISKFEEKKHVLNPDVIIEIKAGSGLM